ncbi:MAG: Rrf2 family transcriptional regulator [bacterium]|nr:Rrf2 family transcriptional regulator [bacterium]
MNKAPKQACQKEVRKGSLHLSQKVDYGLFLLAALAKKSQRESLSLRTIADDNSLSFAFLQKVALLLRQAGLIRATRGREGGYVLTTSPSRIHFKDIIEALEGPIAIMSCVSENIQQKKACPRKNFCSIRPTLKRINDEMKQLYFSKTLSNFLA